jgi:hypothetical protein
MNARNVIASDAYELFGYVATGVATSFFLAVMFGVI